MQHLRCCVKKIGAGGGFPRPKKAGGGPVPGRRGLRLPGDERGGGAPPRGGGEAKPSPGGDPIGIERGGGRDPGILSVTERVLPGRGGKGGSFPAGGGGPAACGCHFIGEVGGGGFSKFFKKMRPW